MRHMQPRDIREIKTACAALYAWLGGIDAAASITRVARSQLSDYANPNKPDVMPADIAIDLEHVARRPIVTALMARHVQHQLVPLPEALEGDVFVACAETFCVAADGGKALFQAALDGTLSEDERAVLDGHLERLVRSAVAARLKIAGSPAAGTIRVVA